MLLLKRPPVCLRARNVRTLERVALPWRPFFALLFCFFFFLSQELSSLSYLFPGRKQIAKTADAADAWFVYTHKYIYVLCRREEQQQQQPVAKDKDSWTELDRGGYVRWLYISIRRDDDGCHVRKASRDFVIYKHNTLRGGQTFCTCLAKTAANTRR